MGLGGTSNQIDDAGDNRQRDYQVDSMALRREYGSCSDG